MKTIHLSALLILLSLVVPFGHGVQASFLEDTAGISASATLAPVDIAIAETAFKNIERRETTYIVGSVALTGYDESHDVHVYVTSAGNIIAYYLRDEPASKIIDWIGYRGGAMNLSGSKLEDALTKVCQTIGQSLPAITYYDFRYPTATNFKIIADEQIDDGTNTFRYLIPASHIISHASWSFALWREYSYSRTSYLRINGVLITSLAGTSDIWRFQNDALSQQYLTRDTLHEVSIESSNEYSAYGAVLFIYSE